MALKVNAHYRVNVAKEQQDGGRATQSKPLLN